MKLKMLLIIICLSPTFNCIAQISIQNITLKNPDSGLIIRFQENKIRITGIEAKKIRLIATNATIKLTKEAGIYILKTTDTGTVNVSVLKGDKELYRKTYTTIKMAAMKAQWGSIQDSLTTPSAILAQKGMIIYMDNCYCMPNLMISQYTIRVYHKNLNNGYKEFWLFQNSYPAEFVNIIRRLTKGDKLEFTKIHHNGCIFQYPKLEDFTLTIR